jgi:hypothetical protein
MREIHDKAVATYATSPHLRRNEVAASLQAIAELTKVPVR